MSLESEARARLEVQRRAAQEQEKQRLAAIKAQEDNKRALNREMERAKSEAISKFRSLNPERLLEEVRRAWHTGRIVRFTDPLYEEVVASGGLDLDGIMLYQRGNTQHSKTSEKSRMGWESGDVMGGREVWIPGSTVERNQYPVDIAGITLVSSYEILLRDSSGVSGTEKIRTDKEPGWFSKKEEWEHNIWSTSFYFTKRFHLDSVRPQDIHDFFVQTTASRMGGAGNIKIR